MKYIIDTIFNPLLTWLKMVYNSLVDLQVPAARPMDLSQYLGIFGYLGPYWISFVSFAFLFGFIYIICFIIVAQNGLIIKFRNTVKWW